MAELGKSLHMRSLVALAAGLLQERDDSECQSPRGERVALNLRINLRTFLILVVTLEAIWQYIWQYGVVVW